MDEQHLAALRGLGQRGATPDRIAELGITDDTLRSLITSGHVRIHRIELRESGPPSPPMRVYMLTEQGAEAIGIDPGFIGLA